MEPLTLTVEAHKMLAAAEALELSGFKAMADEMRTMANRVDNLVRVHETAKLIANRPFIRDAQTYDLQAFRTALELASNAN